MINWLVAVAGGGLDRVGKKLPIPQINAANQLAGWENPLNVCDLQSFAYALRLPEASYPPWANQGSKDAVGGPKSRLLKKK